MLDIEKRRVQIALSIIGLLALSMTAEKFRELVGEESSSKSGKFTFLNCLDMGSGTLACGVKEGVKLYVYSIRNTHVEKVRQRALEIALTEALQGGLSASAAAKQAQKDATKAGKLASRQAKRILGPLISSGWDFFEAVYYGGTMTEGFLRGAGTLVGTYVGGFHGEQRFGKLGYYGGSHLGSWMGGRIGLMVYDVMNGVSYLYQFVEPEEHVDASSEAAVSYESRAEGSENYEYTQDDPEASGGRGEGSENYEYTQDDPEASGGRGKGSENYEYTQDDPEASGGGWGLF